MKISKQTILITLILFIVFASGCAKNLFQDNGIASQSTEANVNTADTSSSGQKEKKLASVPKIDSPGKKSIGSAGANSLSADRGKGGKEGSGLPGKTAGDKGQESSSSESSAKLPLDNKLSAGDTSFGFGSNENARNFGSAKQGMPGNGSAGAFSSEPFSGDNGENRSASESGAEFPSNNKVGEGDSFFGFGPSANGRNFGSAKQGMPGNGSAGAFSAGPFKGDSGLAESTPEFFTEENVGEGDTFFGFGPGASGRNFGSAKQGMPGNGSAGAFSAGPFIGNGSDDTSFGFGSNENGRNFGSAKQGMPGNGSVGAFSSAPFIEEEPFLEKSGAVAQLPKGEEVRRQLPYIISNQLQDIHFGFDRHDLTDKTKAILQKNVAYLKSHPDSKIEIQGHCDERGSNNYNITLGERRVQSTKAYLVVQGIDESRIHTISYGEERPFCSQSNEKCWYQNRRAHFLVAE